MSTFLFDAISHFPASWYEREKQETNLASFVDDLAVLHFSIVLTAKWEASDSEDEDRRAELREELAQLRHLYDEKLDHIAMTFGVDRAMKAKEEVEGVYRIARSRKPAAASANAGPICI
jgi:hypothetical protein